MWIFLAALLAPDPAVVIRHAAVFDAASGAFRTDQTIAIRGERIEAVGRNLRAPHGARIIDARGKFVIPGLIDAHVHLVHQPDMAHMTPEELLPAYLAHGVTTVRDAGDEIVAEKLAQRWAEANPLTCPRVFLASPLLDGDPPYHADIGRAVTSVEKVPEVVADLDAWGVTTVKIYVKTGRDVGRRIIEEGHRRGLKVAAHLGQYRARDAVNDGVDVLEHIWSVFNYSFADGEKPPRHLLDLNNPVAVELRQAIVRKGTMVDPTLAVFRNMILLHDREEIRNHSDNASMPQRLKDHWERYRQRSNLQPATQAARAAEFKKYQELTGLLHRAGVTLLAGTDSPEPWVPPGGALHQELEMLVGSGLTPAEALRAATVNNARALGQERNLGSIDAGKLADIVILGANPLDSIANTRRIERVIRGGQIVSRSVVAAASAMMEHSSP